MGQGEIDNTLREALQGALLAAFDESELQRLVRHKLGRPLAHIAGGDNLTQRVFRLLEWAERSHQLQPLVEGAVEQRPHDEHLRQVVEKLRYRWDLDPHHAAALAAVERLYPRASGRSGLVRDLGLTELPAKPSAPELVEATITEHKFVLLVETMAEEEPDDEALQQLLSALKEETGEETRALLKTYLEWLIQRHDKLLHFHTWAPQDRALEEVFVRVTVAGCVPGEVGWELEGEAHRLVGDVEDRELEDVLNAHAGDRWTLVGNPGAGKTTLLRRVAIRWAQAALEVLEAGGEPVVPVYLALASWPEGIEIPEHVEKKARTERPLEGLAGVLRGALQEGRALVLLDGLDEVEPAQIRTVATRLGRLARGWEGTQVVVASRPHGYVRPSRDFGELELLPLDAAAREALAKRWLEAEKVAALCARIERDLPLREMAEVPLLMTMICLVEREGGRITGKRTQVYEEVVKLLLRGKPTSGETVVRRLRNREVAKGSLRRLALALLFRGGVEWPREVLEETLLLDERVRLGWDGDASAFLHQIEDVTGILFAVDSDRGRYRFLHRSLQEYLVACELHGQEEGWKAQLERVEGEIGRWAEVFSLLAGMLESAEAVALLKGLFEARPGLGLRALATCDGLEDEQVVEVLGVGRPDYKTRYDALAERATFFAELPGRLCVGEESPEVLARSVRLIERLLPGAPVVDLAFAWLALEGIDCPEAKGLLERERFFAAAGRPVIALESAVWCSIPAGTFWMGSMPEERERFGYKHRSDESPRHKVGITRPFKMLSTPVTGELYARFDPAFRSPWPAAHPVARVTWYEAFIFAKWLGGRLPTEAEWEYACRAGTETAFWSGETESDLARVGWYRKNSGRRTHPVGEKPANPWGLLDMHGNVWEWCWDRYNSGYYRQSPAKDPPGPAAGGSSNRVVRGGSYDGSAPWARAAYRSSRSPGYRGRLVGFRVVVAVPQDR